MKAIKKLALLLAALATVFAFASCSDDDDDDDDDESSSATTSWVYEYSGTEDGDKYTETKTIYFYDGNTFSVKEKYVENGETYVDSVVAKGTYTGDTTKASETIKLTVTQAADFIVNDSESDNLVSCSATGTAKVSSDGKTLTVNITKLDLEDEKFTKQ